MGLPKAVASAAFVAVIAASCSGGGAPGATAASSPASSGGTSAPTASSPASGSSRDWPTYAHDAARSGVASGSPAVGTLRPSWRSPTLDGDIYAQPLVVGDRVVVATEDDSLYAMSLADGSILWRTNLGAPMPLSDLSCGNIDPSGITGTPVIDPSSGLVFAVAFIRPGFHELVSVRLGTGAIVRRVRIDPPGADPLVEQQRGALTLANGRVYVPFGGLFGDCGSYHGWVVAEPADLGGPLLSFQVPTGRAGGIWAPPGLTLGSDGTLYAATGNSDATTVFDYGDSVLRLSPDLHLLGFFSPSDWATLNAGDVDLGSAGPALVRGGLTFQVGKGGVGYLLDAGKLGGVGGQLFEDQVCGHGAFGADATSGSAIFVPCSEGPVALRLGDGPMFSVAWRGPSFDPGSPVLAGEAVWFVDTRAGVLYGFDAASGQTIATAEVGPVTHFTAPSVAGGRILVAATDQVVAFTGV